MYSAFISTILFFLCFREYQGTVLPSGINKSNDWVHQFVLDTDTGVSLKWKSTEDENESGSLWLTMEMFAPTKGYVGVGFSPHGGMTGADIVLGWVDSNGIPHIKVCKNFY